MNLWQSIFVSIAGLAAAAIALLKLHQKSQAANLSALWDLTGQLQRRMDKVENDLTCVHASRHRLIGIVSLYRIERHIARVHANSLSIELHREAPYDVSHASVMADQKMLEEAITLPNEVSRGSGREP